MSRGDDAVLGVDWQHVIWIAVTNIGHAYFSEGFIKPVVDQKFHEGCPSIPVSANLDVCFVPGPRGRHEILRNYLNSLSEESEM